MSRLIAQTLAGATLAWITLIAHATPFNNAVQTGTTIYVSPITDTSYAISQHISGSGAIGDNALATFGANTAMADASVDQYGLHTTATIHADTSNNGQTAFARAYAVINTPFMITPGAGFTGTQAFITVPYSLDGLLSLSCLGLSRCTGLARVDGRLSVSNLTPFIFDFLLRTGSGTQPSVNQVGILSGYVPVNIELNLFANLQSQAFGQAFDFVGFDIDASSLFGSTLGFQITSTDNVNIVFPGLTPTFPPTTSGVPEPETLPLLVLGLLALAVGKRRRRTRST